MAYGTEYYHEYRDKENILNRLEILKDGFTDPETLIPTATGTPVILHHIGEKGNIPIIQGQELIFRFFSFEREEYNHFMTSAYKDRKIKYWQGSTLVFEGYLKPENIVTEILSDAYIIELTATNALADLKEIEFLDNADNSIITGKYSGLEIIKYALEHIGIELDFKIQLGTYEKTHMTSSQCALDKIEFNAKRFVKQGAKNEIMSCHAVIEETLARYNCTLSQTNGYYKITNKYELNSHEFLFAWSDLSETSRTATNNIVDITNYEFRKGIEHQKIHPLNKVGLTFRNKDLGGDVTGFDLTDWSHDPPWEIDFSNGYSVSNDVVELKSNNNAYEDLIETAAFGVTKITENDYLKITFDHILFSHTSPNPLKSPLVKIVVTRPDTSTADTYFNIKENWDSYESGLSESLKITGTGNYEIALYFKQSAGPSQWTTANFKIKDFAISKVVNVEESGDMSDVTFDEYYEQTNGVGIGILLKEVLLADGGQINELGTLQYNDLGTYKITEDWRTYGNTEDIKLIDIYARNILNDRYEYKDYWRIEIFDAGVINFSNILQFNDDYFVFVEFAKDFKKNIVSGAIVELLTTKQSYDNIKRTALTSINGEEAVTSPNVNPVIPSSIVHNDTTNKQGGQAGEYYHLTNAQHTNVGNLDSMAYVPTTDYYTKANLDGGQLDNRYYTETEVNTWRNSVTQEEMGWLHGISSDVQTQINAKDNYNHWKLQVNAEGTPTEADWIQTGDVVKFKDGNEITVSRDGQDITIDCDITGSNYIATSTFTADNQVLTRVPTGTIQGLTISTDSLVGRVATANLSSINMTQLRSADGKTGMLSLGSFFFTETESDARFAPISHTHDVGDMTDISSAGSGIIISSAERTKLAGIATGADDYDHWIVKVNSEATPQEAEWVYSGGSGVVNFIGGDQITIGRQDKDITIDCDINPSNYIATSVFTANEQVLRKASGTIAGLTISPDSLVGRVTTTTLSSISMSQLRGASGTGGMLSLGSFFYSETEVNNLLNAKSTISGTPANDQLAVWTNSTTIEGTNNLVFDATGLAIGTGSANHKLDVRGEVGFYNSGIDGALGDAIFMGSSSYPTTYRNKIQSSVSSAAVYSKLVFSLSTGTTTYADVLMVRGDGRVGVNQMSPSYDLDVNGTGRFTGHLYCNSNIYQGDSDYHYFGADLSNIIHNGTDFYFRSLKHGGRILLQGENISGVNKALIYADPDAAVELYWAGIEKLKTTTSGVEITGGGYVGTDEMFHEGHEDWQTDAGGDATWNMATSRNFDWAMTGSNTLYITNAENGSSGVLIITANGSYTATLPANSTPATIGVTAANNVLGVFTKRNNGNYIWSFMTFLDPV